MLGRLLEFSVATSDILASYEFYRALGFTTLDAAEAYGYRYGALGDGRIVVGLHESAIPALSLTYVQPDLGAHARRLKAAGVEPSYEQLSSERLNELGVAIADGPPVRLVEARTFSPAGQVPRSVAGWFDELAVPVEDLQAATAEWERVGFVRCAVDSRRTSLTSDHLSLTLHAGSGLRRVALCFTVADPEHTRRALDALGVRSDPRLAAGLGFAGGYAIVAPEGTPLVLAGE